MPRTRSGLLVPGPASITRTGLALPKITTPSFNPLSIGWAHAYWTEGPEFAALGLANGAFVTTWPDEIGTDDLGTTGTATAPTLRSAAAGFNNRPAVGFDPKVDNSHFLRKDFADIAQPFEVHVVCRMATRSNGHAIYDGGTNVSVQTSSSVWSGRNGGTGRTGGTSDTIAHVFQHRAGEFATAFYLQVDGTIIVNQLASGSTAFTVLTLGNNIATNIGADWEGVFFGVKASLLTAQERTDLRAWAQSRYATP